MYVDLKDEKVICKKSHGMIEQTQPANSAEFIGDPYGLIGKILMPCLLHHGITSLVSMYNIFVASQLAPNNLSV